MESNDACGKRYCSKIPSFNGKNYENWSYRVRLEIEGEGLLKYLNPPPRTRTQDSVWQKEDCNCRRLIVSHISDSQLEIVKNAATAFDMWQTLSLNFKRTSEVQIEELREKFNSLQFDGNDLNAYLNEFRSIIRMLREGSCQLEQKEMIQRLLSSLPSPYKPFKDVIRIVGKTNDLEDVIKALRDFNIGLKNESSIDQNQRSAMLNDGTERNQNSNCNTRRNNFNSNNKPNRMKNSVSVSSSNNRCSNCNMSGHNSRFCRKPKTLNKSIVCYKCQCFGHFAKQCQSKIDKVSNKNSDHKNLNLVDRQSKETVSDEYVPVSFLACNQVTEESSLKFVVDSGASDHFVCTDNVFSETTTLNDPIEITTAKRGVSMNVTKKGKISSINCEIKNVLYAPDVGKNLLSVGKITNNDLTVVFRKDNVKVIREADNTLITEGKRVGNLYEIEFAVSKSKRSANVSVDDNCINFSEQSLKLKLWHARLGHLNPNSLKWMCDNNLLNFKFKANDTDFCEPCAMAKSKCKPHKGKISKTTRILELVHTDVCSASPDVTFDGFRYFLTFLDDFSNFVTVYLIRSKSEVADLMIQYITENTNRHNLPLSRIRCDNGGEYINNKLEDYCKQKGVILETTIRDNPEQNGKAEKLNDTLLSKARTLLISAGLAPSMWGEAVLTAAYLYNRTPSVNNSKLAAVIWYNKDIDYSRIKVFGSDAYCHKSVKQRVGKFDSRSNKLIFVGYSLNGYRLWDAVHKRIIVDRDVDFNEDSVLSKMISSKVVQLDNLQNCQDIENVIIPEDESNVNKSVIDLDNIENVICNVANSESNACSDNYSCIFNVESLLNVYPNNVKEARASIDWKNWKDAIESELKAINENNTWTLVERPRNVNVLTSRWVFRVKENLQGEKIFKARLVARGYEQDKKFELGDIYAPVVNLNTVRTLLSVSNHYGYHVHQLDISNAFLYGKLVDEVYLEIPDGVEIKNSRADSVFKLNRSLYGLNQAPKAWNDVFNEFVTSVGLKRSEMDECLYYGKIDDAVTYLVVYVDDVLISSASYDVVEKMKNKLSDRFKVKQLTGVRSFLGINIVYDRSNGVLKMNQRNLIKKVVERFNVSDAVNVKTPIEKNLCISLDKDTPKMTSKPYKQLLGCLMYVMLATRPDLCYAVSYFGQYQNCATDEHFNYLLRVLKYLKSTKNYDLVYRRNYSSVENSNPLEVFVDADWANCLDTRHSVSGCCFKLFNDVITWKSSKQTLVTLSSTESEFVSLCSAVSEVLWMKNLLLEIGIDVRCPIIIREDSQSCIKFIKRKNWNTKRSKHIDVKYRFVKEKFENNIIDLIFVESGDQLADMFTKGLERVKFERFVRLLNLE